MFKITTDKLVLRPIEVNDAARFYELCNDIEIARNTARIPYPYSRADADAFIARRSTGQFGSDGEYAFAVCLDDELVACAGATVTAPGVYEIGYWVGADYRGRGVATGAARAVTHFVFDTLGAKIAAAGYFADNQASGRVLERVGFRPTGETVTMQSAGRGCEVETVRMALSRADFPLSHKIVIETGGA